MMEQEKFNHGVQITLLSPDDFLKIKETLTRIGIKSKKNNTLWQSCHILHKRGLYYIMSFKEFFIIDGKDNTMVDEDYHRRNTISKLLEQWGMCKIIDSSSVSFSLPVSSVTIVPHKDKKNYELVSKYTVGSKINHAKEKI